MTWTLPDRSGGTWTELALSDRVTELQYHLHSDQYLCLASVAVLVPDEQGHREVIIDGTVTLHVLRTILERAEVVLGGSA